MKAATPGQIKAVIEVMVDDPRGFDIAQAVIDRRARILEGQALGINPSDLYKDEEVASNYGYPEDYQIGAAVQEASRLKEFFPELDISCVEQIAYRLTVPSGFDGLVVVPKLSRVKPVKPRSGWDPLNLAMERLLGLMKETRPDFLDCTDGKVGPEHLRLHWKTLGAYSALEARTPGDVMVFPAQTGLRHRGRSVRRSRVVFSHQEFGICSFGAGVVLLLHPERLKSSDVLWIYINCVGAEVAPDAYGQFSHAPIWHFYDGGLGFYWRWSHGAHEYYGSASALLPE